MSTTHAAAHSSPGQPQLKAPPVAQLSVAGDTQGRSDADPVRPGKVPGVRRDQPGRDNATSDPCSLAASLALIQRVLIPERHAPTAAEAGDSLNIIEDNLPPLTSSNEVDVELYAILAVIVKDFVNSWYSKITPDHTFVEEIIRIIAHCSRALEQRVRNVDVVALFADEIPCLVQRHYETYRIAQATVETSPYDLSIRQLYHETSPHPALCPVPTGPSLLAQQAENERAYRQLLIHGTLAILLPTDDLQNGPLRILVGDIIADLILGQALSAKVSEGYFLHDAIHKVTVLLSNRVQPKATGTELRDDAKNRLEKFGLLTAEHKSHPHHSPAAGQSRLSAGFWRIMQYGYLFYLFCRYVLKELQALSHRPKRQRAPPVLTSSPSTPQKGHLHGSNANDHPPQPVLVFGIFGLISTLLKVDSCMPWLTSMLVFVRHVLIEGVINIARLDSTFDRFLYHTLCAHVCSPSLLPLVLRNLRASLFPNNSMGPAAPPPPSLEERKEIKRMAAESLFASVPPLLAHRYCASANDEVIIAFIEDSLLDPLDDLYLNKHLVFAILELIMVRLIPELAEQPVKDLLVERGVNWPDDL